MTNTTLSRAVAILLACLAPGATLAVVPPCPPLPDQISVRVAAAVAFDAAAGLYTYSYTVTNDAASAQEVDRFGVDVVGPVPSVASPQGWYGSRLKVRPRVDWGAVAVAHPDRVTNDPSIPPSIVQIKPGDAQGGFSFQSARPPGAAVFHATGFAPIPPITADDPAEAELLAEEMAERCPGLNKRALDQGITGSTIGPVDAVPVRIDVKPGDPPNAVNPRSKGVVPIAILASSTLDADAIDVASVRLVPSGAAPRGAGSAEDVDGDGLADLVLHFPTQDIGLRCGDTVIVLSGSTTAGERIAGFDSIVTAGCR